MSDVVRMRLGPLPLETDGRFVRYCAASGITDVSCNAQIASERCSEVFHKCFSIRQVQDRSKSLRKLSLSSSDFGVTVTILSCHFPFLCNRVYDVFKLVQISSDFLQSHHHFC
jgi:hypothetical protein